MDFLNNIKNTLVDAKDYVSERNKRSSVIGKLRNIIKTEKQNADKAYIAVGKYYYHHLRDTSNVDTEPFCAEIEESLRRINEASIHLEKIYKEDIIKKKSDEMEDKIHSDIVPEEIPEEDISVQTLDEYNQGNE